MSLKRNLLANYLGQACTSFMGIVFIPLYIKYLGIEVYGLISFFAALQVWLGLLDFGMSPVLTRKISGIQCNQLEISSAYNLLRSFEIILAWVSFFLILLSILSFNWVSTVWHKGTNSPQEVTEAVFLIALIVAFRLAENLYKSVLFGLEKQVIYNAVSAAVATAKWGGALIVIVAISPSIKSFFLWQMCMSLIASAIFGILAYRFMPSKNEHPRFSCSEIKKNWKFALNMTSITLLSLVLTQFDKLILIKFLTLEQFGSYSFASTAAAAIFFFAGPISQTYYPKFCFLHAKNEQESFKKIFHTACQLTSVLCGSFAAMTILFSDQIIEIWSQSKSLVNNSSFLLKILVLGNLFNCFLIIPYQAQIAIGWTSLTLKAAIVSVCFFVPCLLILVPKYGANGAAVLWAIHAIFYLFIIMKIMTRKIIIIQFIYWFKNDFIKLFILQFACAFIFKKYWDLNSPCGIFIQTTFLLIALFCTLLVGTTSAIDLRRPLLQKVYLRFKDG